MKNFTVRGYSLFTTVKRELCVVKEVVRHCARFGTEHKSTAESSDSEEETYEFPDATSSLWALNVPVCVQF